MKYLKKFESLQPKYIYDRNYIEECFIDLEWTLVVSDLDYFEIYVPLDGVDTMTLIEVALEKIRIKYPAVRLYINDQFVFTGQIEVWMNFAECISESVFSDFKLKSTPIIHDYKKDEAFI